MVKNPYIKEIFIHLAVWVCIAILPLSMALMEFRRVPTEFMYRLFISPLLFYVNFFILVPKLLLKKKIVLYIFSSVVFLFICNYLLIEVLPNRVFEDINSLIIEQNYPSPFARGFKFGIPIVFSFSIFLLGGVFSLVINYFKREQISTQLKNEQREMKLQFLRTQLNPHFLFNSLNSIYSLVRSKSDSAPEAIITLSELMRYMLYEIGEEKVLLEKELNYIKHYIALQRLRLRNGNDVKLNVFGDTNQLTIYPLLLITFIENAFKYGTDFRGNTDIQIVIKVIDDQLHFLVKNKIGHHTKDEDNSGIGLKNVNNQLEQLYNGSHQLNISQNDGYYAIDLLLKLD